MAYSNDYGPGDPLDVGWALRTWRMAWAMRASAPINILCCGDSNMVGYWASTDPKRQSQILNARMATALGKGYTNAYQPHHSITNYNLPWTDTGTITDDSLSGLGYGSVTVPATTGAIQATATCDRFWVFYQKGTGKGNFSVKIDAAAAVAVTANTGSLIGGNVWDSGTLTNASHTVKIASTTATAAKIEAIMWFNGNGNSTGAQGVLTAANSQTGTGVRVFNGAKFGSTAADFAAAAPGGTWWTDNLEFINPHVVTLAWGTNELNSSVPADTYAANLVAVANRINTVMTAASKPKPSYLVIVPHGTGTITAIEPYRAAAYRAAKQIGAAVIDRYEVFGWLGEAASDPWTFGSSFDGTTGRLHLDDNGHKVAGDMLADFLLQAAGRY